MPSTHRAQKRSGKRGPIRASARKRPESIDRLDLVTRAINEGVYDWDIASGKVDYSERVRDAVGLTREQLGTAADWHRRIHPEDLVRYDAALIEHFKGRSERFECDYRYRTGDGSWRWARQHGVAQRDARGRAVRMVGSTGDVTELKLAEEALRRARDEAEEALAQQTATSNVLHVMAGSLTDLAPVYQAILADITRLCQANIAALFLFDGETLGHAASLGITSEFTAHLASRRSRPSHETTTRLAALERRPVHVPDLLSDPSFSLAPRALYEMENVRTVLSVPMLREGALVGVITTWRREVRPFTDRQVQLVKTFADQAVIAIENARLFRETREALERQTATAQILHVISSSPTDVQPVFDAIVRSGLKLFPGAAVAVVLPRRDQACVAAIADADPAREAMWRSRFPFPLTHEYMHGVAILDGKLVDVPDAQQPPPGLEAGCRNFLASGYRAATLMPMMRGGRAIGTVSVLRLEPGPLSERQLALLRTFAAQAVIAIENVRLLKETTEALEQQRASGEVLTAISSSISDTKPVFDKILESCERLFAGKTVGINLVGEDRLVRLGAYHGPGREELEKVFPLRVEPSSGSGLAIVQGRAVSFADVEHDPDVPAPTRRGTLATGCRSVIFAPMLWKGEAMGAIFVAREQRGYFPETEVALLRTFADQAVIAIQNARLYNETVESLEQQKALAEVLGTISQSITDTKPVFDRILKSCQRLFEGHLVGVTLAGEDGRIRLAAYEGPNAEALLSIYPLPLSPESGSGAAILQGTVQHYPDVDAEGVPDGVRRGCVATGMKSIIFAPLIKEGRPIGALWVGRLRTGAFNDKRIALLKTFADQAVIAIQNARLLQEIHDKSEQVEIANRHKSEFLASMSHELRTPLNAIIGFTRIVQRNAQGKLEQKQLDNLEKIQTSGEHLLALINAVLDLSKVEAGRVEVSAREVELAPVLEHCVRTVEPLVKSDAVTLASDFDGRLPAMFVDDEKLRQIVINLLSNAAKFTAQGSIRLRVSAADGTVRIAVADTGIGIAADKLGIIFEEFRQADAGSTREYGGTGLGLAIARRLARLMGGDIDVESEPGRGSTFTLTLPLRYSA